MRRRPPRSTRTDTLLPYTPLCRSTVPSKGCIISHNYVCNLSRNAVINGKRTKDDISWSPLPLFHLNALAATVLASAMTFSRGVLYPRFSVSNFWPEIERSGATLANLLGSMLAFVADAPDNEAQTQIGRAHV